MLCPAALLMRQKGQETTERRFTNYYMVEPAQTLIWGVYTVGLMQHQWQSPVKTSVDEQELSNAQMFGGFVVVYFN